MALRASDTGFQQAITNADFQASPEFEGGYELLDGKLVKKVPGYEHGWIAQRINRQITLFDPAEKLGVVLPETSIDLGPGWVPQPDLAFLAGEGIPARYKKALRETPDLVVEVHSPRDLASKKRRLAAQAKIEKYQERGVQIIWAINPEKQTVEVYHADPHRPVELKGVNDELDGENVIPGFKLAVKSLFV